MIKTDEQYLESIRDGTYAYYAGELIEKPATNLETSGVTQMMVHYRICIMSRLSEYSDLMIHLVFSSRAMHGNDERDGIFTVIR